jgi:hypothetical protein
MGYTIEGLRDKILEFHPEIAAKGIALSLNFDEASNRFVLLFSLEEEELGTYLDKKDADACMDGKKCVNLAVQVAQILAELEELLAPHRPG